MDMLGFSSSISIFLSSAPPRHAPHSSILDVLHDQLVRHLHGLTLIRGDVGDIWNCLAEGKNAPPIIDIYNAVLVHIISMHEVHCCPNDFDKCFVIFSKRGQCTCGHQTILLINISLHIDLVVISNTIVCSWAQTFCYEDKHISLSAKADQEHQVCTQSITTSNDTFC